jgi:hypothetical protein
MAFLLEMKYHSKAGLVAKRSVSQMAVSLPVTLDHEWDE